MEETFSADELYTSLKQKVDGCIKLIAEHRSFLTESKILSLDCLDISIKERLDRLKKFQFETKQIKYFSIFDSLKYLVIILLLIKRFLKMRT